MKCYLVKLKEEFWIDIYLLFVSKPYKDCRNEWTSSDGSYITIFGNEQFSDEIKLPEGDDIVEVDLTISASAPNNFRKGSRVSYTTFNLLSFLIHGVYRYKHITDVLGVDYKNKKILVHKYGEKKAKWYDWDEFEIV